MIKMQNRYERACPLCRADTVLKATDGMYNCFPLYRMLHCADVFTPVADIDLQLMNFLERWFPKETKEKQAYNEIERKKELFGEALNDLPSCNIM